MAKEIFSGIKCHDSKAVSLLPEPAGAFCSDSGIGATLNGIEAAVLEIGLELTDQGLEFIVFARFGDLEVADLDVRLPAPIGKVDGGARGVVDDAELFDFVGLFLPVV